MIDNAARNNAPVFLPPGNYDVSNLTLPDNTRITGIPGASRLVYGGEGHLMSADKAKRIELSGLVLDGGNRWLADYAGGLLRNLPASTKCSSTIAKSPAAANMRCNWSAAAGGSNAAEYQAPRKLAFILSSRPD